MTLRQMRSHGVLEADATFPLVRPRELPRWGLRTNCALQWQQFRSISEERPDFKFAALYNLVYQIDPGLTSLLWVGKDSAGFPHSLRFHRRVSGPLTRKGKRKETISFATASRLFRCRS